MRRCGLRPRRMRAQTLVQYLCDRGARIVLIESRAKSVIRRELQLWLIGPAGQQRVHLRTVSRKNA